eukprot:gene19305-biopygen42146
MTLNQGLKLAQQVPFITRPKQMQGVKMKGRGSVIDHVWSNIPCRCSVLHTLGTLSDHEAIRVNHAHAPPVAKQQPRFLYRRAWKKVAAADIARIIEEEMPKASLLELGSAEHALVAWNRAWERIKTELAPRQRFKIRKPCKGVKVAPEVRAARKERNRLHRLLQKEGATPEVVVKLKHSRDNALRLHRASMKRAVQKHWDEAGGAPLAPAHWRVLDQLAGRKARDRSEPECSPDKVNDTFLAKPAKIRAPLLGRPPPCVTQREVPTLDTFAQATEEDVVEALRNARTTHSFGIDEIPMAVLKRAASSIAPQLAALANAVMREAWWPPEWKNSEVHPLWKRKGCKNDPNSYRPISLLPAVARVVERLIVQQLKAHVRPLLPKFQHGFRAKHSCEKALALLIDHVVAGRDAGDVVVVASADLAGAFDTVDHEVLINKLEKLCGLRSTALRLLAKYLEGRQQRTVLSGNRRSGWRDVPCGVPQGSVLGPLLFTLYTLDVGEYIQGASIV